MTGTYATSSKAAPIRPVDQSEYLWHDVYKRTNKRGWFNGFHYHHCIFIRHIATACYTLRRSLAFVRNKAKREWVIICTQIVLIYLDTYLLFAILHKGGRDRECCVCVLRVISFKEKVIPHETQTQMLKLGWNYLRLQHVWILTQRS